MTDLDDLRCFLEVLESGGFNRAAARLGVAKSIVSRRVAAIEADLGVRLLTRSTHGVTPTDAGLELQARAARILADIAEAREAVAGQGGDMVGRLRVAAPLSFGVRHVAPALAEFAARHPRIEIEASFADRLVDMAAERFDLAVRIGALRDSSLIVRQLAPVRALLVASPDYLDRSGRPATPADLETHECLIYTGGATRDWRLRAGRRWVTVRPNGRLLSDSGDAMLGWAVAGLGIANLPSFVAARALADGSLEMVLPDYSPPDIGVFAVRPPGTHVPSKVRALTDMLAARFGAVTDWAV